ncbi:MAG: SpoIIE family protein phosphatase [Candidatus Eisenbacteria bacterium]
MSVLVAWIAAALAVVAHWRAGRGGRPVAAGGLLRWFAAASLAAWGLLLVGEMPVMTALRVPLLALSLVPALVAWWAMMALLAVGWRRRDLVARTIPIGLALWLVGRGGAPSTVQLVAFSGLLAWRWKETLPSARRFQLGVAALVLAVVLFWIRPLPRVDPVSLTGSARALHRAGWAITFMCAVHALFGSLALFRAWVRDPSLGIRAVTRRLALSHVLVGLVPLLLLAGLWVSTTVLGALNERAIVGARVVAEQGRWFERVLAAALDAPADAPGRLVAAASLPGASRIGTRVWWRHGHRLERLAGDPTADETRLDGWLDSLATLPRSGVLQLGDSLFLAAAARTPSDSTAGAILAAPLAPVLRALADSVARARLGVWNHALIQRGTGVTGADERADSAAVDSLTRAITGRPGNESGAERRARLVRALGGSRSVRADSGTAATRATRNRLRGSIVAAGDTLGAPTNGAAFLLEGHALALGLHWNGSAWRGARYMITASEDPWRLISGLVQDTRSNVLGIIPLMMLGFFTLLALLVLAWDLAMVTGMGRSIAEAVGALRGAAIRLGAGDLTHRITVRGDDDLWQVAGAFNHAAAELERARAAERERQRVEDEMEVARRIQMRLLPSEPPRVEGLEVAGHYDPALEVGGDYYDHIVLDAHRVLLVIADVSGKSVPAALIMSGFRAALVSQDLVRAELSPLAARLNEFLIRSLESGKFVTAFLAVVDGRDGSVAYVNAGHNPPLLLRADGSPQWLQAGGTLLGILPGGRYEPGATRLERGDLLVLYTDGVTEGAGADAEQWGENRLLEAVTAMRTASCATVADTVAAAVRAHEGSAGATDDITLVVARRL